MDKELAIFFIIMLDQLISNGVAWFCQATSMVTKWKWFSGQFLKNTFWILGDGRVFIFKANQPANIIRTLGFREAGVRRSNLAKADLAQLALRNSHKLLVAL